MMRLPSCLFVRSCALAAILGGASLSTFAQGDGAASAAPDPAPRHPELAGVYAQFGGDEGMVELMEVFMQELLADPRMRPFFEGTDQERVKRQLAEQFCAILGGGCTYSGRDMRAAHEQLGATRADFNALVEDLQIAMNKQGIPFRAQNKLLAILAPMHREVITR